MTRKYFKTEKQKLDTKLSRLSSDKNVVKRKNSYFVENKLMLRVRKNEIEYLNYRYKPGNIEKVSTVSNIDSVIIKITHRSLNILNANILNPPNNINKVYSVFKHLENIEINKITICDINKIEGHHLYIDLDNYYNVVKIEGEENVEKSQRVFNRFIPFLKNSYQLNTKELHSSRDYSLLLKEIIASGEINQEDIIALTKKLKIGETNQVVIEKQINKQTQWLLETIEEILEVNNISVPKAKEIGNEKFGFLKTSITGPEHLMERILSDYGQYCLFGVPALLNTNKYVIRNGRSRSQFDLILINHLGDVEVVELKRPDKYLLEYGNGRGKFYPSKDLAIAIAQTERYITSLHKDNDEEYKIDKKTLREFLNSKIGNTLHVETIRPKGLIIMGSWFKLSQDYDSLDEQVKKRVTRKDYDNDSLQAYKELTNSLKNITILTYSELLENARTRLELENEKKNNT
ncbi:MAG TPA: Shedu anti-phage system protein SduA domain-containing protein [Pelobium sp.]|nr:Shedu anti-phage system protein SduA domain-containing protein [Pelobium sp.]